MPERDLSRRLFLKTIVAGVGVSALAGCGRGDRPAPAPLPASSRPLETTNPIPAVTATETSTPVDTVKGIPYWPIRCVDTMKESRDRARDTADVTPEAIDNIIRTIADTGASHVAIGTPYDEEFVPILTSWVTSAHNHGLNVWFRGNFSGFEKDSTYPDEGWFGFSRETDMSKHHTKTAEFIKKNADLFEKDDIFTPWPEPENSFPGGFYNDKEGYQDFLKTSYANAGKAFSEIGKSGVKHGYFSMNGDVAKALDPKTVTALGNTVVIDHYVKTLDEMGSEIQNLKDLYTGVNVILGEFGAPNPDKNGDMTESEQATFIEDLFKQMIASKVGGMNYWTLLEASTELMDIFSSTDIPINRKKTFDIFQGKVTSPRMAFDVVSKYFTASKKNKN